MTQFNTVPGYGTTRLCGVIQTLKRASALNVTLSGARIAEHVRHIEMFMNHSKSLVRSTAFNSFLYAGIGDDKNGMELTLLSALARQNMDPWQKAADLSRLPGRAAMLTLETWLKSVPGHESPLERSALAGRLLSLLPQPGAIEARDSNRSRVAPQTEHSPHASEMILVLTYFISMVLAGWYFSENTPAPVTAQSVAPTAAAAVVASPVLPPSTSVPQL